jgi:hypothetical protein
MIKELILETYKILDSKCDCERFKYDKEIKGKECAICDMITSLKLKYAKES